MKRIISSENLSSQTKVILTQLTNRLKECNDLLNKLAYVDADSFESMKLDSLSDTIQDCLTAAKLNEQR